MTKSLRKPSGLTLKFLVRVDASTITSISAMHVPLKDFANFPVDSLGFPKNVIAKGPHKDLYPRAGVTIRELILACRKIAHMMTIENSDTCDAEALAEKMWKVPGFIEEWQKSSARGAARLALALFLARNPDLNLDVTDRKSVV